MPDRGRRVLVVDDDPSIQGFLAEALADEGYGVRTAANGREALQRTADELETRIGFQLHLLAAPAPKRRSTHAKR